MKPGKLYGVGIGPGDPRYLTLRAADVLRSADVIFTVISRNASSSVSRSVVEYLRPRGEIRLQMFSMSRDKATREAQVRANADKLTAKGKKGKGKAAEPAAAPAPAERFDGDGLYADGPDPFGGMRPVPGRRHL